MSKEDKTDTGMGCAACQKRTQHRWYGNEWQCRECGSSPDLLGLGLALAGVCDFRDNLRTRLAAAEAERDEARAELERVRGAIANILDIIEGTALSPTPPQPTDETDDAMNLECPCCGDVAAEGIVNDGDPLICGCNGQVSLDAESPPYISCWDEEPCPRCGE